MSRWIILLLFTFGTVSISFAQDQQEMKPEDTEKWEPIPEKVKSGGYSAKSPPSDAVVLFDGSSLDSWESTENTEAGWEVKDGTLTVVPGTGGIQTKKSYGSVQMHIEWRVPENIEGKGQDRGNSGVFLQSKYELQVLDSFENETYTNGMAGSIYKQHIPKVNAARAPGKWQSYDIIFKAPAFGEGGDIQTPASMTVFWNGIMIHHNVTLEGPTRYIGYPEYEPHEDKLPISLQDHGSRVSFRNIWLREL